MGANGDKKNTTLTRRLPIVRNGLQTITAIWINPLVAAEIKTLKNPDHGYYIWLQVIPQYFPLRPFCWQTEPRDRSPVQIYIMRRWRQWRPASFVSTPHVPDVTQTKKRPHNTYLGLRRRVVGGQGGGGGQMQMFKKKITFAGVRIGRRAEPFGSPGAEGGAPPHTCWRGDVTHGGAFLSKTRYS